MSRHTFIFTQSIIAFAYLITSFISQGWLQIFMKLRNAGHWHFISWWIASLAYLEEKIFPQWNDLLDLMKVTFPFFDFVWYYVQLSLLTIWAPIWYKGWIQSALSATVKMKSILWLSKLGNVLSVWSKKLLGHIMDGLMIDKIE